MILSVPALASHKAEGDIVGGLDLVACMCPNFLAN